MRDTLNVPMHKRLITPSPNVRQLNENWLNLDAATVVAVTEETGYPGESALVSEDARACNASGEMVGGGHDGKQR
jgi:hypothetical protein